MTETGRGVARKHGFIRAAWLGEESLALVFWLYGVVLGNLLGYGVEFALRRTSTPVSLVAVVLYIVYSVWWSVSLWRCAANSTRLWGTLARVLLVFGIARTVWEIATALAAA